MTILIYLLAGILAFAGLLLVIQPDFIFNFLSKNSEKLWVYVTAIVVRLFFGGILIYAASFSKFPLVISILGWLILIAAVILLVIGRKRFETLVLWVTSKFKPYGRIAGVFSLGFGIFLIYAFM